MSFDISTLITDRGAGTYYNASDLNRVGAAVQYVAGRFAAQGYAVAVSPKTDWTEKDIPTASELETYRQNIATLRALLAVMPATPETPNSMAGLTYTEANDIAQIRLDLDALLTHAALAWYQSGEIYAGEV